MLQFVLLVLLTSCFAVVEKPQAHSWSHIMTKKNLIITPLSWFSEHLWIERIEKKNYVSYTANMAINLEAKGWWKADSSGPPYLLWFMVVWLGPDETRLSRHSPNQTYKSPGESLNLPEHCKSEHVCACVCSHILFHIPLWSPDWQWKDTVHMWTHCGKMQELL